MPSPDAAAWAAAAEATWPAAAVTRAGIWTIREGRGGGSRVSAATTDAEPTTADLATGVRAMESLGQTPQVIVKAGQDTLDRLLEGEGWAVKDPVVVLAAPVEALTAERPPPVTAIEVWPPLAIQREIWAAGGIGPARLAVMDRAPEPKTTLLGRIDDRPAATAYVGVHAGLAVLHALETAERFRRRGLARHVMRGAAFWARDNGASHFAVLVTRANGAANALYADLGMTEVAHYHYRIREAP